ncbi:Replication factor C (RF-C) subunit [Apophysomyces sp. BC1034]|nr:Replication factor C (RF-C) subunit [Apophysomyces sp. BC1015]KAG0178630.1 Replication factor C (RF-C) subunit [Apophysomyces sp. BC1021]KAG0188985.1 Replication factor C (RF-C) subunit [Apophysomyces sp. BC1034]
MALWLDKHKPKTIDQLTYHKGLTRQLKGLAASDNVPHILFYGPAGAGKKTRIAGLLREMFGPGAEKLKVEQRPFITTSNRKLIFNVFSSNYHLELNPSDLGIYDRVIVQDVIKEIAESPQIDTNAKHKFKIVLINQADDLTREAQAALRRTMEKYTANIRLILCCDNLSKVIDPVRSRCLLMRVSRPTVDEVTDALQRVAMKENLVLSSVLAKNIAEQSKYNMREALLMLESTAVQHPDLTAIQRPEKTDWQILISTIAKKMTDEPTLASLAWIRTNLYDLFVHGIPSSLVIKTLTFELFHSTADSELRKTIMNKAAFHEYRLTVGTKEVFHLEAFVVALMGEFARHGKNF